MACICVFLKKGRVPPPFLGGVEPTINGAPPPRGSHMAQPRIDCYTQSFGQHPQWAAPQLMPEDVWNRMGWDK